MAKASTNVLQNRGRGGEINYDINIFQRLSSKAGGASIFCARQSAYRVSALLRDFGNQRPGLPSA